MSTAGREVRIEKVTLAEVTRGASETGVETGQSNPGPEPRDLCQDRVTECAATRLRLAWSWRGMG